MKKIIIPIISALAAFVSCFSVYFSTKNIIETNKLKVKHLNEISQMTTRINRLEYENSHFAVLREYGGIIGIFDKSEKNLIATINIPSITLPMSERTELISGIYVRNADELAKLIEAFSS